MPNESEFSTFILQEKSLISANRPIRMRMAHGAQTSDDLLLPQTVYGTESICGGIEYRVLCVSTNAGLSLKNLIALPVSLEFVTDRGALHTVCGIVTQVSAGDSDGGIATYQVLIRDALAIMEKRTNTRIFRNANEFEVVEIILSEWRQSNSIFAGAFEREVDEAFHLRAYPRREFIMQHNESDSAFIQRLLRRQGIGWYFRAGRSDDSGVQPADDDVPAHTIVFFNNSDSLPEGSAGIVNYQGDRATEQRDTITSWCAVRTLQHGTVGIHSWDYKAPTAEHIMNVAIAGECNQGPNGNEIAASLDDYLVAPPHSGEDHDDLCRLGQLRMTRHDFESKCFHGEGSVRDFRAGEFFRLDGHAEIDAHPTAEREFIISTLAFTAHSNLPAELSTKVDRLFASNRWTDGPRGKIHDDGAPTFNDMRFRVRFTAVRRGTAIVPAYDPRVDLPHPQLQSVVVVGPPGEEVHCDQLGRVKVRFPGLRVMDHAHAQDAGTSGTDADSAWVRVASNWAGNGPGSSTQCGFVGLPRAGTEALVSFLGGDPDRPIIIGQLYNQNAPPPALSSRGGLPGNRYLSGIKSREIRSGRGNQLRFDDTTGQISAQLSSDDGASQLNLGWLSQPRADGEAAARGEGAELRSDKAVAVRGAKGVLISARGSAADTGTQLERTEFVELAEVLHDLVAKLSKLAVTHSGDAAAGPELLELINKLKNLHKGTNVEAGGGAGGEPIVAITGPAGVIVTSEQHLALGAKGNVEVISAADTCMAAGGKTSLRSVDGFSQFTNKGGIKTVAAKGKVLIQAQDDHMELLAKKVMEIISTTDWINIKAKQGVRIYGGGSELEISQAGIMGYTTGNNHFHAADHQTFPKQARQTQFADELPHHEICVPCLLVSLSAHNPFAKPE